MSDSKTLEKGLLNAERAMHKLDLFLSQEPRNEVTRAAVIQAFEFTFEAFWKLLQKWGAHEGLSVQSPKSALSFGFQRGTCWGEQLWLNMLRDRNLTVHTYNEALAEQIHQHIRATYAAALSAGLVQARQDMAASLGSFNAKGF